MTISRKNLLVAAILVIAILSALALGNEVVMQQRVRRAIVEIESLNGSADDLGYPPRHVTFAIMGIEPKITDSSFQRLLPRLNAFSSLESLDLSGTKITADGLKGIEGLTTLKRLELPERCIADKTIKSIAGMKLKSLYIYGTNVPADAASRLHRMSPTIEIQVIKRRWSQPAP